VRCIRICIWYLSHRVCAAYTADTAYTDCRSLHSGQTVIGLLAHRPRILQILLPSNRAAKYLGISVSRYLGISLWMWMWMPPLNAARWHVSSLGIFSPCVGAAYAKLFMKTEPGIRKKKNTGNESLDGAIEIGHTLAKSDLWINKDRTWISRSFLSLCRNKCGNSKHFYFHF